MRIEHFAYQVEHPAEVAEWYKDNFGFTVKRESDIPVPVRFLADASGQVMLEVYNNPKVETPNYSTMDPLLLHVAFVCNDVPHATQKLTQAGATLISMDETSAGDVLAMLRDPWGLAIQLCHRSNPMI
ncbi:VOC family protein [Flagellimonas myxillae]|uniref:VOC family protein n=1 Tax=Flagellimonas myxillae TaxID=2942214 RepID=UPI00201EFE0E|nr:VOC family protein [Muricauda myxillae]MCL6265971.1 VOC family protein [Muricauda myxillae]